MLVFSLSERMGGRMEVLNAPIIETLGYLIMTNEETERRLEKEETERWLNFLALFHSHPEANKEARNKFMKLIEPKQKYDPIKNPIPEHKWDMDKLERLKAQQERG